MYKYFKLENIFGLRKVTISNPKKRNALNIDAYSELTEILNNAVKDDSVTIVALTGEGEYYSSGNDISAFLTVTDPQAALAQSYDVFRNLVNTFCTFPKLIISVVNGPCIGIAATTAAMCDVIYATDTAYFYTPFSLLGLCAEGGASYTFPRILGKSKASEMLLLNHKLIASEAKQYNFVSNVFKNSELDSIVWPKIIEFSKLPKESLKVTKELMTKFDQNDLKKACERELEALFKRFESPEFMEAVLSFAQRKSKL